MKLKIENIDIIIIIVTEGMRYCLLSGVLRISSSLEMDAMISLRFFFYVVGHDKITFLF